MPFYTPQTCEHCEFLDTITTTHWTLGNMEPTTYDLYYCGNSAIPTYIARYGNLDHQYASGDASTTINPALAYAKALQKRKKLYETKS